MYYKKNIKKRIENEYNSIKGLDDIKIPELDQTINKIYPTLRSIDTHKNIKIKSKFILKPAINIMFILIISFILSILYTIPSINAYKNNIISTVMSIGNGFVSITKSQNEKSSAANSSIEKVISLDEARLLSSFHMYEPKYLPYTFNCSDASKVDASKVPYNKNPYILKNIIYTKFMDGTQAIKQIYSNGSSDIEINQYVDFEKEASKINLYSSQGELKQILVKNIPVYMLISKTSNKLKTFWYKNNYRFEIIADISEEELISIIENME